MNTDYETIIVGAGLAGLFLANLLESRGSDYLLIEARDRVGGRVLTEHGHDLGPSWYWTNQPRIQSLIQTFALTPEPQHEIGDLIYDNGAEVQRLAGQPPQPWMRLAGGMGTLAQAMAREIPRQRMRLETRLERVTIGNLVTLAVQGSGVEAPLNCQRLVLTLPPRLLADTVEFEPALTSAQCEALSNVPTWMAGHAKAVVTYASPFWKDAGLSGDAFSQRGPLGEIHDASTADTPALFGFFAWPYAARQKMHEQALRESIVDQLTALFGKEAASPTRIYLKDWSADDLTSTPADHRMLNHHPLYGLRDISLFDGKVLLAGTETSLEHGGVMEGALASAERASFMLSEPDADSEPPSTRP